VAYPLIYVFSASLSDPISILNGDVWLLPKGLHFNAYKEVFKTPGVLIGYRNTILYAIVGTFINMVMTIIAAYPLSRRDLMGGNFITFFITFTMFFSGGMIPTYLTIKSLNMLNTFWVMVIPGAINVTNFIIMRNFFQYSVPNELIEAAYVDGCFNIGILWKIVLPISKSILAAITIFYLSGHWNTYFDALIYLSDKNKYPLQVFLRQILIKNQPGDMMRQVDSTTTADLQLLFEVLKYAIIVVSSLPMLILYPMLQKHFVKGIMMGSIKG